MLDKRIFTLAGARRTFGYACTLTVLQAILLIVQVVSLSQAITRAWERLPGGELLWPVGAFVAAYTGRQLLVWYKQLLLQTFAARAADDLRAALMTMLFRRGYQMTGQRGIGSLVALAQEGIKDTETYLELTFGKLSALIVIMPATWVALLWFDVRSAIIVALVMPVMLFFMIILGLAARAKADKQYVGFQQMTNYFTDALRGLPTLHQLGLSHRYVRNIYQASETYRTKTLSVLSVAILSTLALDFFTTLSVAMVALFLGMALINGHMVLFPALAVLLLVPEFFMPLRDFASDYHATLAGKNAFQNLLVSVAVPLPRPAAGFTYEHWQPDSTVELRRLTAGYQDGTVLKDVSFSIQGCQTVGVVGVSGSGKTSLINVLAGFMEPASTGSLPVLVNDESLPHLQQPAWQRDILYVPQKPHLFRGTIAENITFYQPDAPIEAVQDAAYRAGLEPFITSLSEGLQTVIGEGARAVSGGQAQRIMLARAFLDSERRILLFDEPTAHLDIETELELKETMRPLFKNRLVFFATHRLHWLDSMDYLLVLEHGRLLAAGTPAELLKRPGSHRVLLDQMGGAPW